jgi:DNA-binding transcriptional MerR regulator
MAYKKRKLRNFTTHRKVSEMFSVAPSLIRFWESEFDLIKRRTGRKPPVYKEDIDHVRTIHHLVKEKGFTLQGAKRCFGMGSQAVRDKMEFMDSLSAYEHSWLSFAKVALILV